MPATSEIDAIYRGSTPVDALYRGSTEIWTNGPNIPAGVSPATYGSWGERVSFENGLSGIGGRVVGQSFLLTTLAFGSFDNATPTGWSLPFDHWNPEVIGYGSNSHMLWAAAKVIVGADQSNTNAAWQFSGVNSTFYIRSTAHKWSNTQHEGIQVLYDGPDDFYSKGPSNQDPTSFEFDRATNIATPGDQEIPANCTSLFAGMANDNGAFSGTGWTFTGTNTASGTDRMYGHVRQVTPSPNNRPPFYFSTSGGTYHVLTPRIVIPGAAA